MTLTVKLYDLYVVTYKRNFFKFICGLICIAYVTLINEFNTYITNMLYVDIRWNSLFQFTLNLGSYMGIVRDLGNI